MKFRWQLDWASEQRDITRSAPGREDRSPITVLGAAGRGGGRGGGYHFIRRSDHFKHPHRPLATIRLTCRYWPEMWSSLLLRDTITHGHCSQCVGTVCLWQDFMLSTSTNLSLKIEMQIQGCGRKRVLSLVFWDLIPGVADQHHLASLMHFNISGGCSCAESSRTMLAWC